YPQSGERIRGRDQSIAALRNHPGLLQAGIDTETATVAGSAPQLVMTKMFTLVRVEGTGNTGTLVVRVRYADGSVWWLVTLYELRAGRIAKSTEFYAPEFPPPEWRSNWVEVSPAPPPAPG